jgi:hypothetical protein
MLRFKHAFKSCNRWRKHAPCSPSKINQVSAAIAAEVKRGELMGYYIERRESTNTNYNISDKPLSEDDWERQYGAGVSSGKTH